VASGTAVSDAKLRLIVNGEPHDVPAGCTIEQLVQSLGLKRGRVAVAVNREVVPRTRFGTHPLAAGDRIEILEAVGGG